MQYQAYFRPSLSQSSGLKQAFFWLRLGLQIAFDWTSKGTNIGGVGGGCGGANDDAQTTTGEDRFLALLF